MAFKRKNYPAYWKQFSEYIRFDRAGNKCERCGIENYSTNERGSKVVLTVAHLDHASGVCRCRKQFGFKCAKPSHVRALCQRCHLNLDREKHIAVRQKNLAKKKDRERKLFENLKT